MEKELKEGYIIDFISGQEVKATPEETEAVQVFSKILVEDYGYPKNYIQTRPQFRVKSRPSDTKKEYPVDIAIFSNDKKQEDDIYIIVECKKKNRKDGKTQLEDYLNLSKAELGVWFNGEERVFIRKIQGKRGGFKYEEIPNIPKFNQRVEDIGKFKKGDLQPQPTHNLKSVFKSIRNYLAANNVGATRDEALAGQLINIIFCKLYDEKYTKLGDNIKFRAGVDEEPEEIKERIMSIFEDVKRDTRGVIDKDDNINLDAKSIAYVVGELQNYALMKTQRDVVGDAFEVFIGHALKGGQGQFFTPRNVIQMMVEILDPNENEFIIDPACGSGGFLIETLRYVWKKIENKGKENGWEKSDIEREQRNYATEFIRGLDKDYFLSKLAKAYMTLVGDGTSGIFNEDSLEKPESWKDKTKLEIGLNKFDIILTNPPFGSKIPVKGDEKLKQFELGYKWKQNKKNNEWEKGKLKDKEAPQILFIERCLQLLKDGGRMAIVLPEGTFGNSTDRYIWQFILKQAKVLAIISTPEETFQPNTHFKTSVLVLQKEKITSNYDIFMSIANTCGHNKNGKEIFKNNLKDDEISLISNEYKKNNSENNSHLGFNVNFLEIKNHIFIPDYYDPELKIEIQNLNKNFELLSIGDLIKEKIIKINRGNEIGSEYYGKGEIPFVRTSDIANWEIKIDPIKCIPDKIYELYKKRQNIKENDILFVKDGTFLIGKTALVAKDEEKIVIQSHLIKISVLDKEKINPYYLMYLFNLPIVQKQIKKYTFIQGTISTIGDRFNEIIFPIHKDLNKIKEITENVKNIVDEKQKIKKVMSDMYIL